MDEPAEKKVGSMDVEMPHLLAVSAAVAAHPVVVLLVSVWVLITPFVLFLYYCVWTVFTSALMDAKVDADEASALDIGIV
ncbi:hypothetical protein D1007_38636 [Hordeum vulgare]|nr:hypothetical protein D1007_38636 [Hordeum vulgare]